MPKPIKARDIGQWVVVTDLGGWMIEIKCPECHDHVLCTKVDIPIFCSNCGKRWRGGEQDARD